MVRTFQPRLFDELDGKREQLQDFAFFRNFSYGCKQVFSGQRWALTGEAGLFLDPFYSPGSDFIAVSNTYITDLIGHDRAGHALEARAQLYDQIYHSFYESTLALYQDQYTLFGDPEVLPVKVIWDYTYYWGVLSQIFFQRAADRPGAAGQPQGRTAALPAAQHRDAGLPARLVARSEQRNRAGDARPGGAAVVRRTQSQPERQLDDEAFRTRMRASAGQLRQLAARSSSVRARASGARSRCACLAGRASRSAAHAQVAKRWPLRRACIRGWAADALRRARLSPVARDRRACAGLLQLYGAFKPRCLAAATLDSGHPSRARTR